LSDAERQGEAQRSDEPRRPPELSRPAGSPDSGRRWSIFGGLAVLVVVADQLTKLWIDANFALASAHGGSGPAPTQVIGDLVRIAKSYNTGGIFGLFGESAQFLALASTLVIGMIVVYHIREAPRSHWLLSVALGLLLGGAIGNLLDRFRLGHVIDFVDAGIGDLRWYTFNVADSAISMAIVLLIVLAVFGDRLAAERSTGEQGRQPVAERGPT
jgi:signal peptidase II